MGARMKVLVTGAGGPAGLNTLKFLPKEAEVVASDASEKAEELALRIRKDAKFFKVPLAEETGYLEAINRIVADEAIDFVIPTVDEELVSLSRNSDKFLHVRVILSPPETIEICNDKMLLYNKFSGKEFCPLYLVTNDRKYLESVFGEQIIFMKPRTGRGSRGVKLFENPKTVTIDRLNVRNVFCEYLPGKEYTVDALCDFNGRLVVAVPRVRLATNNGISVHGKTEKNEEILKYTEEVCNTLKFIGPINIQFKFDAAGRPKLVEINPRISGGFPISVASGVNKLELLYDIIQGKSIGKERLSWTETESEKERL